MILLQEAKDEGKVSERLASIVNALRQREFRVLIVEPTGNCNLKCSFCDMHNDSLDTLGSKKDMSDETFSMLIKALEELPYKFKSIQIHGYGEPLLNKNIVSFTSGLRPFCDSLRIITNGTALTLQMHDDLIAAGVDEIHVSLDIADRAEYHRVKQKDLYDKVMRNILAIIPKYSSGDAGHFFIKLAVPASEYSGFWGDRSVSLEFFEKSLERLKNLAENSERVHIKIMPLFSTYMAHTDFKDNKPCEMPFYMLKIKANGDIDCCCAAIFGELRVGHISDGLDLHDNVAAIRKAHLSNRVSDIIPMCGTCAAKTVVDVTSIKQAIDPLI